MNTLPGTFRRVPPGSRALGYVPRAACSSTRLEDARGGAATRRAVTGRVDRFAPFLFTVVSLPPESTRINLGDGTKYHPALLAPTVRGCVLSAGGLPCRARIHPHTKGGHHEEDSCLSSLPRLSGCYSGLCRDADAGGAWCSAVRRRVGGSRRSQRHGLHHREYNGYRHLLGGARWRLGGTRRAGGGSVWGYFARAVSAVTFAATDAGASVSMAGARAALIRWMNCWIVLTTLTEAGGS